MKRVFICSRYGGDIDDNVRRAKAMCKRVADRGDAPYAPHLLCPRFLNEESRNERNTGILIGLEFLSVCHEMLVDTSRGISEGMSTEIAYAVLHDIPIVRVDASGWSKILGIGAS